MNDDRQIAENIRLVRVHHGITQAEVSRRTGIHRPNVARIESARHSLSLKTIRTLCEALDVDAYVLLFGKYKGEEFDAGEWPTVRIRKAR